MRYCPVCTASLIPTAITPKPTYILSDAPIKQPTGIIYVMLGIAFLVFGIYLMTFVGKYLYLYVGQAIVGVGLATMIYSFKRHRKQVT